MGLGFRISSLRFRAYRALGFSLRCSVMGLLWLAMSSLQLIQICPHKALSLNAKP